MTANYGGRYQVIERVGSGGMADVFRARDELLGREVAVKVLSERFASDRSFVERFRREAQAAANLNHPNIVSLYDYGADDGTYYIVMELIDGRPLDEIISSEGPLLPERAAEIASDVSQALGRAHVAGIVHRDIKPSNIMITSSGQTKVTDFGIARALAGDGEQTMTQTGMVIGTAAYLSPEQAQGAPVDARTDVYSMGVVLYEMLTGRAPFTGDTPLSIAYKHVREAPTPPSRIAGDVPRDLEAIVLKAMSKNPENRYSSAGEMNEDLQRFLSGQRVQATPVMADETMVATPTATGTRVLPGAYDEEEEEERSRAWWYVLLALLLLALFGLGAWLLADNLLGDPVRVPDLVGRDADEAREILEDRGLEAEIVRRPSQEDLNEVFKQDPEGGETINEGDTVTLFVSEGPKQVEVPDVVGDPLGEARDRVEEEGLEVRVTREASDEVEEDRVIRTSPTAGTEVDAGSVVELVVSQGPEPTTVPFVVGQSEDDARAEIEAASLQAEVRHQPSDQPEGEVIAQDPDGGTEAEPGDTVVITVSEGPEEREMPDVTGENGDAAEQFLEEEYGLDVTQEADTSGTCTEPPGHVCDQEPDPNDSVSDGDDATLFVQPGGGAFTPGGWIALTGDYLSLLLPGAWA